MENNKIEAEIALLVSDAPFAFPRWTLPQFGDRIFDIRDYGAIGDGQTLNTVAINRTINACAQNGGGRVNIPPGIWLTGPIFLQSNIDLHLEKNALLLFSRNFADYPLIETIFEGTNQFRCLSPINAVDLENIAITGEGIIDGSGDAWRPVKRFKMTERQWQDLIASGGVVNRNGTMWWPTLQALKGENLFAEIEKKGLAPTKEEALSVKDYLRPVMVRLQGCVNVLLDGPTFQNSPAWNIHPFFCENVIIRHIAVRNPWYAQNGDGLDIESCKNVLVYNSIFDVGDDAICLKSGKDEEGRRRGRPTETVVIKNCTVYRGHGGFTIGSEMSGGVKNVLVSGCLFLGTDIGLRFKSGRGRGGIVENIFFRSIRMQGIQNETILFDLFYNGTFASPENATILPTVEEGTPQFRRIFFQTIVSIDAACAGRIEGLPEMPVKQIKMDSLIITAREGIHCRNVQEVTVTNAHITCAKMPLFRLSNSRDVLIAPVQLSELPDDWLRVEAELCKNIRIVNRDGSERVISSDSKVAPDAVNFLH